MIPARLELKDLIAFVGLIGAWVALWLWAWAWVVDGLAVIGGVVVVAFLALMIIGRVAERGRRHEH